MNVPRFHLLSSAAACMLILVACRQAPEPPAAGTTPVTTEAVAGGNAGNPDATTMPVAAGAGPQVDAASTRKFSGSVSGLTSKVSGLRGLVSALGGEVRDNEIYVALPADTLFAFDKAEILPAAEPNLAKLAELIGKTEGAVQLIGHADGKGGDAYNLDLSQRRAAAVQAWLEAHGVSGGRLQAQGRGAGEPVAANQHADGRDNPEGRARNRRVEAIIPKP